MRINSALLLLMAVAPAPGFLYAQSTPGKTVQITKPTYKVVYEPAFVLEAGIDNVLRFSAGDPSVKRLLVNSSQGKVTQKGEDFIIHPESKGELVLKIYNYNDLSNPLLLEERKMEVRDADPAPGALFAGKAGGKITRKELGEVTKIEAGGTDRTMMIREFKLSVAGKDIEYREFSSRDENLTADMIASLKQLPVGSKIYIEYIRAGNENEPFTRMLAPLAFTVTE